MSPGFSALAPLAYLLLHLQVLLFDPSESPTPNVAAVGCPCNWMVLGPRLYVTTGRCAGQEGEAETWSQLGVWGVCHYYWCQALSLVPPAAVQAAGWGVVALSAQSQSVREVILQQEKPN